MKKELEAAGYEVDLQYASNDVSTQVSQLENQVANGCDLLVVASIDGSSLGEPLKQAKEAGCEKVFNGMGMMLFQALIAIKLYTGKDTPVDYMKEKLGI